MRLIFAFDFVDAIFYFMLFKFSTFQIKNKKYIYIVRYRNMICKENW